MRRGCLKSSKMLPKVCPLCDGSDFEHVRDELLRCRTCRLVLDPVIWHSSAPAQLEAEWFGSSPERSKWLDVFEALNNRRTWKRLARYLRPHVSLLEVGIGSGSFLDFCAKRGLKVMGCDLSSALAKQAYERFNVNVVVCPLEEMDSNEKYDVIIMNHILEHVSDPRALLSQAKNLLASNGIIHVAVPNIASWGARLSGWVSYEPYHLLYFDQHTLTMALEKSGLRVMESATHESFSGWFLAILRTAVGRARRSKAVSNGAVTAERKGSYLLRNLYRSAMAVSGILTLPLRLIQELVGTGDEIIIIAATSKIG